MQRRTLLAGLTSIGTVAITGCSNTDVPLPKSEDDSEEEDNNGTDGEIEPDGESNPEEAVEQYYTALLEQNAQKANEVLHANSGKYPVKESEIGDNSNIKLVSVEKITISELGETVVDYNRGSEQSYMREKERVKNKTGTAEAVHVLATLKTNGEKLKHPVLTIKKQSGWVVW
jgi:hypothetical protein